MEYTVTQNKVCGKINGEKLTEMIYLVQEEVLNIFLHQVISKKQDSCTKSSKRSNQVRRTTVLKDEPEAFVFNNFNYEGDK
jgi:hypothetical protein